MASDNFTTWRKATYSHGTGHCVEVGAGGRVVGLRDTAQHGAGPLLQFPAAAWQAFTDTAKYQSAHHFS